MLNKSVGTTNKTHFPWPAPSALNSFEKPATSISYDFLGISAAQNLRRVAENGSLQTSLPGPRYFPSGL